MAPEDGDFVDGEDEPLDDDAEDQDRPLSAWLPPDDRLWRHPSEMAALSGGARGAKEQASLSASGGGHRWAIALSAGVTGALIATGVVFAVHGGHPTAATDLSASTPLSTPRAQTLPASTDPTIKAGRSVMSMANSVSPALVAIEVDDADGGHRGTGVVYRSDGVIITTSSLVQGASDMSAVMTGGQEVAASLVGVDPAADIAVLKVDYNKLPTATLASSQGLKVGQLAVAVMLGNRPDNAGPGVYLATVSGVDQQVSSRSQPPLTDAIETDAPVGDDTGGGVLLNELGQVVGITVGGTNTSAGMRCLAIPADVVSQVATQLLGAAQPVRGWLGIEGTNLSHKTAQSDGVHSGVQITRVDAASPAAASGMQQGDAITSVNGQPVVSMLQLQGTINLLKPGAVVSFGVEHEGQQHPVQTTLGSRTG